MNESMFMRLSIRFLQLEQDNIGLKSGNETLAKSNELLQNQLHAMDDRVKDVQRMLIDAKATSKEYFTFVFCRKFF